MPFFQDLLIYKIRKTKMNARTRFGPTQARERTRICQKSTTKPNHILRIWRFCAGQQTDRPDPIGLVSGHMLAHATFPLVSKKRHGQAIYLSWHLPTGPYPSYAEFWNQILFFDLLTNYKSLCGCYCSSHKKLKYFSCHSFIKYVLSHACVTLILFIRVALVCQMGV